MQTKGKVLVTGGTGFIGTELVEQLHANGYEVTILDKNNTTILVTDTVTGNSISVNTIPGCQNNFVY